nr:hypothetical protein [Roseomonas sp. NPKOSM-4]
MDVGDAEGLSAKRDARIVEAGSDGLHARRCAFGPQVQGENSTDDLGLVLVDGEHLLHPRAALSRFDRLVAVGRTAAVPVTLASVLAHRPERVFRVLLRVVFVDCGDDPTHQHAVRIVTHLLRHGDEPDADFVKPPRGEFDCHEIACEPTQRMDEHDIERSGAACRLFYEALESGALVISAGGTGLDELRGHGPPVALTVGAGRGELVGDREIGLSLLGRRDAGIHGHTL